MNLSTTNLLAWIDERIDVLNDLIEDCKSMEERERIGIRLYEISGMRDRILQERENEKAVIVHSYSVGVADYLDKRTDCYKYYTTTFNPNK